MKIIHLSDFHLNNDNLKDWKVYTKPALFKLLKSEIHSYDDMFFVCTGDLVDKAGSEFGDLSQALKIFTDEVITPILEETGLTRDRFLVISGNHDIDRTADENYQVLGMRSEFDVKGVSAVNKFSDRIISEGDFFAGVKRIIPFVEYQRELYSGLSNIEVFNLGMSAVYNIGGESIGFACFNSSWNALDDDFESGLVLGEPQYTKCQNIIKDCTLKVALMHQPIDWLKREKETIVPLIYQDFNLCLAGHVHEKQTSLTSDFHGTLFVNIAPKYNNEIRKSKDAVGAFSNGFTIIDYSTLSDEVYCSYFTYVFSDKKYALDTDKCPDGRLAFKIPQRIDPTLNNRIEECLKYISQIRVSGFDKLIIPQRAKAITTVLEAFVAPPIYKNADEINQQYFITDITNSHQNQLLFGAHESGKSIILYRVLIEFVNNYHQYGIVPIYINFQEIGNRDFETIIREFADIKTKDVRDFLDAGKIVLLIDDYVPTIEQKHNVNKLYKFSVDNNVRIIATSQSETGHIISEYFSKNSPIAFEYYFIDQFRADNIKSLMIKWSPKDEFMDRATKLEKMVNRFCSFSLPCTAMSVSLYLWSTENSDREPINQAVLLDIYMNIILEKLSEENIYRSSFDYDNKIALLSKIAYYIHTEFEKDESFLFEYGTYLNRIEEYLDDLGFKGKFDSTKLGEYFITQKVFVKEGNKVSYAHSCFYFFLLAQRMKIDPNFKAFVLSDENCYRFARVIDYYGGLNRSDRDLLTSLQGKVDEVFQEVQSVYHDVDIDTCFTKIRQGQNSYTPLIDVMEPRRIVEHRPSKEQIEKKLIEISDNKIKSINDKIVIGDKEVQKDPLGLLFMLATALRNLDTVEDPAAKQKAYNTVIKNALIYTVIYKDSLAIYANAHNLQLPPSLSMVKNVDLFFRFMPYTLQRRLSDIMGSAKLSYFIKSKLSQDSRDGVSDTEKYMSTAMLWDIEGLASEKQIKSLIKKVGRNSVQDYLLIKLITKFFKTIPMNPDDDIYMDLIASLKVKNMRLGTFRKGLIIQALRDERLKQKQGLIV